MRRKSRAELREEAHRQFIRNSLDKTVKVGINDEFQKINPIARKVLTDEGFQEFLSDFISREWTKLRAYRNGSPTEHPYDGEREKPLCTCNDRYCPLKEGTLPRPIRVSDNPLEELRAFKHKHSGDPFVLQDATERYDELCTEFDYHHRRIIICGQHNTHPDDLDGLTPTTEGGDDGQPAVADD